MVAWQLRKTVACFCHGEWESIGMFASSNAGVTEILAVGLGVEDRKCGFSIDEPANLVPSLTSVQKMFSILGNMNHYEYVPVMVGCSFTYGQTAPK